MPGLPVIELSPDVVFIIFLPPLLYYAAWYTNWNEAKKHARPIALSAIGLVFFTTLAVAVVAHFLIPAISWPVAFLLGAIISPPDAVAATSLTKGLGPHPRLITILEGESLINDASGLIAYKYALATITAGNFVFWEAGINFLTISTFGVAIGLIVGIVIYQINKNFFSDDIIIVCKCLAIEILC